MNNLYTHSLNLVDTLTFLQVYYQKVGDLAYPLLKIGIVYIPIGIVVQRINTEWYTCLGQANTMSRDQHVFG
jgi:hypothetical protein